MASTRAIKAEIADKLKDTPEQKSVVGPLVEHLAGVGWGLDQMVFGKAEWRVPKSPSQATRREKGHSFDGFPVDIAVFDDESNVGDPRHLLFIVECKQPNETAGVTQLECYFVGEPHVQLAMWANDATPSANAVFLYRKPDGRILLKRQKINDVPQPGEAVGPETQRVTFTDSSRRPRPSSRKSSRICWTESSPGMRTSPAARINWINCATCCC